MLRALAKRLRGGLGTESNTGIAVKACKVYKAGGFKLQLKVTQYTPFKLIYFFFYFLLDKALTLNNNDYHHTYITQIILLYAAITQT